MLLRSAFDALKTVLSPRAAVAAMKDESMVEELRALFAEDLRSHDASARRLQKSRQQS